MSEAQHSQSDSAKNASNSGTSGSLNCLQNNDKAINNSETAINQTSNALTNDKQKLLVKPNVSGIENSTPDTCCRICREPEDASKLITPCNCRGSIAFIHKSCLKSCIEIMQKIRCSICRSKYRHVDIRVRFPTFQHYVFSHPAQLIIYSISILSLIANQAFLLHRSLQYQIRHYEHVQKERVKLFTLGDIQYDQLLRLNEHKRSLIKGYSESFVSSPNNSRAYTMKLYGKHIIVNHGTQPLNQFTLPPPSEPKKFVSSYKSRLVPWSNLMQLSESLKVHSQVRKLAKKYKHQLQKRHVHMLMRYFARALFYALNDALHLTAMGLFAWYLYDKAKDNYAIWKIRSAQFDVIL